MTTGSSNISKVILGSLLIVLFLFAIVRMLFQGATTGHYQFTTERTNKLHLITKTLTMYLNDFDSPPIDSKGNISIKVLSKFTKDDFISPASKLFNNKRTTPDYILSNNKGDYFTVGKIVLYENPHNTLSSILYASYESVSPRTIGYGMCIRNIDSNDDQFINKLYKEAKPKN